MIVRIVYFSEIIVSESTVAGQIGVSLKLTHSMEGQLHFKLQKSLQMAPIFSIYLTSPSNHRREIKKYFKKFI